MSTVNVYFSQGTRNEQGLIEDIIIESLKIYGMEMMYIPRTLVSKDNILGEDRLSQFKTSFPIEMYFENVSGFEGQGAFMQKFGLMMEQSATLVVARRRWEQLVGRYGVTTIPTRPNEGDLIYFPLSGGLFEIKFVQHQDPFYQLGKLYVYKLQIELFQYSSERIDTGNADIDAFETLKTFSTNTSRSKNGRVVAITNLVGGSGYTNVVCTVSAATRIRNAVLQPVIVNGSIVRIDIVDPGEGYYTQGDIPPHVHFVGDGVGASAGVDIEIDIDKIESYGDNNSFVEESTNVVFDENNPFGDS